MYIPLTTRKDFGEPDFSRGTSMNKLLLVAMGAGALAFASQSQAAVTIVSGSFGTSGGVHSTPGLSAPTVTGTVNGDLVTLSSTTDIVDTSGGGESVFSADDGSMQQFKIQFANSYQKVTFDIFKPTGGQTNWTLAVNGVNLSLGGLNPLTQNTNKFIVDGGGTLINSLTFTFTPGEQDIREIRVGSAGTGVPEPATWAMMLTGFGGMGALLRRRRQTVAATA
ncbi:MAG: PEPxxWA-CTERM sorting domain-containing protein [Phenylobacterium sp.]